jgi:hypothetical protein
MPATGLPTPAPTPRKRRLVPLAAKFIIVCLSLLIALLAGEFVVRIVRPQPVSWLNVYASSDEPGDGPAYGLQQSIDRTISNGRAVWTIHTDAKGFRCADPASSAAAAVKDAPVLLNLGDSFTFGFAVDHEQSMPGLIEAGFGKRYHVVNAGIPGYGPVQYRQVLERELAAGMAIKGVIVSTYLGNDFLDCITDKNTPVHDGILGNENSLRGAVKRNSHLYRLTSNAVHRLRDSKAEGRPEEAVLYQPAEWTEGKLKRAGEIFQAELIKIRDICRSRDIPLLVCIIPTDQSVEKPTAPFDVPAQHATALLSEAGIRFIDMTPKLVAAGVGKTYLGWDFHFTALGNQITADAVVQGWDAERR